MNTHSDAEPMVYDRQLGIEIYEDASLTQYLPIKATSTHLHLFIITNGRARLLFDEYELSISNRDVACILPRHKVCLVSEEEDCRGTVIRMTEGFFGELKRHVFSHDYRKFHLSPVCALTEYQAMRVKTVVEMVATLCALEDHYTSRRVEMVFSMAAIAYELLNICRRKVGKDTDPANRSSEIFNQFSELLAIHYRTSREVKFYAELLYLSPKYFSNIIRQSTGVSAGKWIDDYVIEQAKRVLRTRAGITIQETGYLLGFSEPASFIHFFKRNTGMTPKEYRKGKEG